MTAIAEPIAAEAIATIAPIYPNLPPGEPTQEQVAEAIVGLIKVYTLGRFLLSYGRTPRAIEADETASWAIMTVMHRVAVLSYESHGELPWGLRMAHIQESLRAAAEADWTEDFEKAAEALLVAS
jgi:hypothetical protein